jgi:hypothetical protein
VLLKEACTCTMPSATSFFIRFLERFELAITSTS